MDFLRRLLVVLAVGYFFSCNPTFAQLQYSVGPSCSEDGEVVCPEKGQVVKCFILEPIIHIEYIKSINGEKVNRFQPTCSIENDSQPACIDTYGELGVVSNAVPECIEPVECIKDKDEKLVASCLTEGKEAKCLGSKGNKPNCNRKEICDDLSIPVCDYSWQAFAGSSNLH